MNVTDPAVLINGASPFSGQPLVIKASDADNEVLAIQFKDGTTQWHVDLNGAEGPGVNLIETGRESRLFIKGSPQGAFVGIRTNRPTDGLDVNGTFRVRDLPPSNGTYDAVAVDANGRFYRSVNGIGSSKAASSSINMSGRWMNAEKTPILNKKENVVPIFKVEDYKDGGKKLYQTENNTLRIKQAGRYDIRINLALLGNIAGSTNNTRAANTSARIVVNGLPVGVISAAANNGLKDEKTESSIYINEILQLNVNDIVTVELKTDANPGTIQYNKRGTCSFAIIKLR